MGNEKYFDENVVLYDRFRPDYGVEIFEYILTYASITEDSRILEIGCGPGNATLPFILRGGDVTAVEIGKNLCDYVRNKFSEYPNFRAVNCAFEEYETSERFDLIFAATSFHWIKSEFAYPRCREYLKSGGSLATFWNTPRISRRNDALYEEIQTLYQRFMPDMAEEKEQLTESEWYQKRCQGLNHFFQKYGYSDIIFKLFHSTRTFTAEEYIGLLHTYSDHMALPDYERKSLFDGIHSAVSKHGNIIINDTIDLHMGRCLSFSYFPTCATCATGE